MHYLCMQAVAINNRSLLKTPARPRIFPRWNTTSQSPFSDPISFDARASFWLILTLDANSSSFFFSTMQLPTNTCNHVSHRHVYKHVYNRLANYELETHLPPPLVLENIRDARRVDLPRRHPGQNEHPRFRISDVLQKLFSSRKFHPERNDDTTRGYIFQTFLSSWAEFWRNQTLSFVKCWIFGLDIQNAYITKSIRKKQSDIQVVQFVLILPISL